MPAPPLLNSSPPKKGSRLLLPSPPERGRSYVLVLEAGSSSLFYLPPRGEVIIGRGSSATLHIPHPSVSRQHARLSSEGSDVRIVDLQSHNGTRVNGERVIGARALVSGDVITLGAVTLVFHRDPRATTRRPLLDLAAWRLRL